MRLRARVATIIGRAGGSTSPTLSVVVPVYNVEAYLAECLDSLLEQTWTDLEVVAVDDGSTDGSPAILQRYAEADPRVRVVRRPNGGLGAARNTGVEHAHGRYLAFVDSDDVIPPDAYRRMVEALELSGSDLVLGQIARWTDELRVNRWSQRVHARTRRRVTLEERPELVRDFYSTDKVYRADFWRRHRFRFREVPIFEDQPLITEVLCRAAAIDVLPDIVYHWRARPDASSISDAMLTDPAKIAARAEAIALTRAVVDAHAGERSRRAWFWTLIQFHFRYYLTDAPAERFDDVRAMVAASVTPEELLADRTASPDARVLAYLALTRDREAVAGFHAACGDELGRYPVVERDGRRVSRLPGADGLPPELLEVADWQFAPWARLVAVEPTRDGAFAVTVRAGLDCLPPGAVAVSLWAEHLPTGDLVALPELPVDRRAPDDTTHRVDLDELDVREGRWRLLVRVGHADDDRWIGLTRGQERHLLERVVLGESRSGNLVGCVPEPTLGLVLGGVGRFAVATDVVVQGDDLVLTLWHRDEPAPTRLVGRAVDDDAECWTVPVAADGPQRARARLPRALGDRAVVLRIVGADAEERPLSLTEATARAARASGVPLVATRVAHARLESFGDLTVDAVRLTPAELIVDGIAPRGAGSVRLDLVPDGDDPPATEDRVATASVAPDGAGRFRAVLALDGLEGRFTVRADAPLTVAPGGVVPARVHRRDAVLRLQVPGPRRFRITIESTEASA